MENSSLQTKKIWLLLIAMILVTAIIIISLLRDRIINPMNWQVSFTGQGKMFYEPDIANIMFGVRVDKKDKAEDALNELNEKINKIFEALETKNIPRSDIKTQNYSLYPQYDMINNISTLSGYSANQVVVVKLRGIKENSALPSEIIKAAGAAGINQIDGITFEPSNMEELKQEARVLAIQDAKNKADNLSSKIGVKLGKIVSWWENYNPYPIPYYGDMGGYGGGEKGGAMLPSGTQEIIVEVTISYLVK